MKYYVTPITNAEALIIQSLADIGHKAIEETIIKRALFYNKRYVESDIREGLEILVVKGIFIIENEYYLFANKQTPLNDIIKPEIWGVDVLGMNLLGLGDNHETVFKA